LLSRRCSLLGHPFELLSGKFSAMVGDEAKALSVSRVPLRCLELAATSPMLRSVEREDFDDSGGDFVWGEGPRRPAGAEASVTSALLGPVD
jgi:hypothetical protein